jgi:DNA modification methylase
VLGRHRLLCGDSTVATDVERVLGGVAPHLMVTDPPYGVSYDPAWRNRAAAQGIIGQKKTSRAIGEVVNDDRADWREAWALFPGSVAYISLMTKRVGVTLRLQRVNGIVRSATGTEWNDRRGLDRAQRRVARDVRPASPEASDQP